MSACQHKTCTENSLLTSPVDAGRREDKLITELQSLTIENKGRWFAYFLYMKSEKSTLRYEELE